MITAAEFHPQQPNTLVYSSSKGVVRLCDLREKALCDRGGGKVFEQPASEGEKSFFSEVISPISPLYLPYISPISPPSGRA